eukprot:6555491-Prymnesium_polylepis.1
MDCRANGRRAISLGPEGRSAANERIALRDTESTTRTVRACSSSCTRNWPPVGSTQSLHAGSPETKTSRGSLVMLSFGGGGKPPQDLHPIPLLLSNSAASRQQQRKLILQPGHATHQRHVAQRLRLRTEHRQDGLA